CKTKGVTPVLMTMASRVKDIPDEIILKAVKLLKVDLTYQEFKELFDSINETIRSKAHENGIPVIDLARQIPQDRDHLYDMVHLTDKGCQRAAEIISSNLSTLLSNKNLTVTWH
ncbi:MAG: SGNH/GDSL hydrolase family protein, partial [Deltaproteobacteria bacterium]